MKTMGQLGGLFAVASRIFGWSATAPQEAAFEDESSTLFLPSGDVVYIAAARGHSRSVAVPIRADWVPYLERVGYGDRFCYVDLSFRTEAFCMKRMRVGSVHLPPESFNTPRANSSRCSAGGRKRIACSFGAWMQARRWTSVSRTMLSAGGAAPPALRRSERSSSQFPWPPHAWWPSTCSASGTPRWWRAP